MQIINSGIMYFKAGSFSQIIDSAKVEMYQKVNKKKVKDTADINFAEKILNNVSDMFTPENIRKMAIANTISSLFCLLGAIMMWHLKWRGFYFYAAGTIMGIGIPLYLFGNNFVTNIQAGIAIFVGILFIIFYAMNIKSMD